MTLEGWSDRKIKWEGGKEKVGKFLGQKRGGKKLIISGREDVFFVHPENDFNDVILNWCIGGCWFTPAKFWF
jgi:hypothetical protein